MASEKMSQGHEHFESDAIALAKLVLKESEKPGKFMLPHGISDFDHHVSDPRRHRRRKAKTSPPEQGVYSLHWFQAVGEARLSSYVSFRPLANPHG